MASLLTPPDNVSWAVPRAQRERLIEPPGAATRNEIRARAMLIVAACALVLAIAAPLWRATIVALPAAPIHLTLYATHLGGDLAGADSLAQRLGLAPLDAARSPQFGVLPVLLGIASVICLAAAFVRCLITSAVSFGALAALTGYALGSLQHALHDVGQSFAQAGFGTALSPSLSGSLRTSEMTLATGFAWGALLPLFAALCVATSLWLDARVTCRGQPARD